MQEYIIELSKYGITVCMLIYTLSSLIAFLLRKETTKPVYLLQCAVLFLTQLLSFVNLTLVSGDKEYLLLYGFVQAFLLAVTVMVPLIYESIHRMLLNNMCMLMGSGFCILS